MRTQPLNYEAPRPAYESSRVWSFLAGCALVAPFLTVPIFVIGAALVQDYLINGDGQSWRRATLWFGIPTGVITVVLLTAAIRALALSLPPRRAAIFAAVGNALALGLVVYAIFKSYAA